MISRKLKKISAYILSFLVILVFWIVISRIVNSNLIFPSPLSVLKSLKKMIFTSVFWDYFLFTFLRVLSAFVITIIAGFLIGFFCGRSDFFNDFIQLPLQIVRVTPVIAIILIVIFWFKSDVVPVFICVLMTLPVMITSVSTGFKQNDKKYEELSKIYCLNKNQYFFYIKLPVTLPYVYNGALQTFGLCWKVILASEVLCIPKKSLGNLLQKAQMNLETSDLAAVTLFVILVCFILEKSGEKLVKMAFIEKQ